MHSIFSTECCIYLTTGDSIFKYIHYCQETLPRACAGVPGRVIGPCVCVLSVTTKEPFRQNDGLKADIYATCRITFTFMSAVVLETAIYSATSYSQYAVFFRVLPCTTPYSSV